MGEQLPSEAEIVWERILFRVSLGHISFYFVCFYCAEWLISISLS